MRTTVDLDEDLLESARRVARGKTKRAVIEEALAELVRARSIEKLRSMMGNYEIDLTPEDLRRMRGRDREELPD